MTTSRSGLLAFAVLLIAAPTASLPAAEPSPYAALGDRPIAALDADEIAGYLAGQGMGLALPAELNGYPGPKHVLELAEQLGLDESQRVAARAAFDRMHAEAVRLGARYVELERELDALFAGRTAEVATVRAKVVAIGAVQAGLRDAHLQAHLEMVRVLSAEQIARYDELRGYSRRRETPRS